LKEYTKKLHQATKSRLRLRSPWIPCFDNGAEQSSQYYANY
jgi:hypothetical protein